MHPSILQLKELMDMVSETNRTEARTDKKGLGKRSDRLGKTDKITGTDRGCLLYTSRCV